MAGPLFSSIVFVSALGARSREAEALRRDARRGLAQRICQGAFVMADDWVRFDATERHLVTLRAIVAGLAPGAIVSHASAVALHGLPSVDLPGSTVHVIDPKRDRVRHSTHLVRHPGPVAPEDVTEVHGMLVTSEVRTSLDVARSGSFADGVLCLDGVLRRHAERTGCFGWRGTPTPRLQDEMRARVELEAATTTADVLSRLEAAPGVRGLVAARRVVDFSSPWAENGGESLCRIALAELGAPTPRLQVDVFDEAGLAGRCDFLLGRSALEFDGGAKYDDSRLRGGRRPSAVVRAEKARERRIVRSGSIDRIGRCDLDDVQRRAPLALVLRDLGVPLWRGA
jgi:hypothetical protein